MAHLDLIASLVMDQMDRVEEILGRGGVNINARDASGRTALDYVLLSRLLEPSYSCYKEEDATVKTSYLNKAKLLLEHGADPNSCDKQGWTIIHQCAWDGNLPLLQLCVRRGGKTSATNKAGQLPVDLAFCKNHTPLVRYLEGQSCDLSKICRMTIREIMGKKSFKQIHALPIPASLKLYLNYGIPYPGWEAPSVVPQPWTKYAIQHGEVEQEEVKGFLKEHASKEFLDEQQIKQDTSVDELIQMIEELYFWEAFKTVKFEEELAPPPAYTQKRRPLWEQLGEF